MPVKENQPHLYEAIRQWFDDRPPLRSLDFRTASQTSKGHGRLETRTLTASTNLNDYLVWPHVGQALCLERRVVILATGEVSTTRCMGVTDLAPEQASVEDLLSLWRNHWDIENGFHYPLDVILREDASRLRSRPATLTMATLRRIVFQLVRSLPHLPSLKLAREHFARAPLSALALLEIGV